MLRQPENGIARAVVEFCRFARENGVSSGTRETINCLQALSIAQISGIETLKFALRAVLCSSKEEWDLFDDLFDRFWGIEPDSVTHSKSSGGSRLPMNAHDGKRGLGMLAGEGAESEPERQGNVTSGASAAERLKRIDLSRVSQADWDDFERISQRLLHEMCCRVSRRLRTMKSRGRVDLRRTTRRSICHGGDPIELSYKGRKLQPAKLVILLDISGSMNLYSLFLLKFVYALEKHSRALEAFVFSTDLVEITKVLRARRLSDALAALSQTTAGWSGGTRIGVSLQSFNRSYARKLLSRGTFLIVLSDGWDTGEPEVLATELARIKQRVRKLIWLNPLLGLDHYEPITRGMSAARPHIDVFAPAHNLQSLLELERHLR
ncbi:MAG TPA: VWA domain-containing protein [Terriglobia bacterium]|nr:VWA domain-containing protein [Terriglobia bacterium]